LYSSATVELGGGKWSASNASCFTIDARFPWYLLNKWLGRPQIQLQYFGEEKNLLAVAGFKPWTAQLIA